jgi:hypothetical protein
MHNKTPCGDFAREAIMTSEMTAFAIAVGGTSLVCYLLMTRLQNGRADRSAPRDGFLPGGNYTAPEGWIISSRLGSDNPAFDSSGNPSDPAGGDSGGGADGGGGDGGGGGGDPLPGPTTPSVWSGAREVLDSFQFVFGSVWNHFKRGFFFLHRSTTFNTDSAASPRGLPFFHDCLFLQRP